MKGLIFGIFFIWKASALGAENPEVKTLNFSFDDFTVINSEQKKEDIKKPEKEVASSDIMPAKPKEKSALDDFFDRSLKLFDNLKRKSEGVINSITTPNQESLVVKKPEDPAKKFPDPLFYDAIYTSKKKFITYSYIYEDKSNKDNNYIPRIAIYDIYSELFSIARTALSQDKFYELFHSLRLEKSFNINEQDKNGNTLLLVALRNGNFEVFYFLLNQGANPSICNKYEICPIQIATYSNNLNLIKALTDKNVNIRVYDKDDLTPIEYTIYEDRFEAFEVLFKRYLRYIKNVEERERMIEFAEKIGNSKYTERIKKGFGVK